jgi:hypothetical protein
MITAKCDTNYLEDLPSNDKCKSFDRIKTIKVLPNGNAYDENEEFLDKMEKLIHDYYPNLDSSTFVIKLEKVSLCKHPYIIEINHYKN